MKLSPNITLAIKKLTLLIIEIGYNKQKTVTFASQRNLFCLL